MKTIPKSSIPVLEIIFWFKQDAVLRNRFCFVFFWIVRKIWFLENSNNTLCYGKGAGSQYVEIIIGEGSTGTPRRIDVDSMWMLRRYVEDQISTIFHIISTYFFDVILDRNIPVVSTYFFDVISLVEKSTLFPLTFFDAISMVKKSTLFPRSFFFDVLSLVEISMVFLLTFFDVILVVQKSTLFARTFFDKISVSKILRCFC